MSANEDNANPLDLNGPSPPSPPDSPEGLPLEGDGGDPRLALGLEDYPKVEQLITEDDAPVETVYAEKQMRLLTEPLYSSWAGPGEGGFIAMANVGLFFVAKNPALVPDVLLSLDVEVPADLRARNHRSYFLWEYGKPPDVLIEIVSDRLGGEETHKLRAYARGRVPYYVIYDPEEILGNGVLRVLELRHRGRHYQPRQDTLLPEVGLGLTLWQGAYEGSEQLWLRWCDLDGQLIPSGRERAEQERQRAEQERQRAEQQAAEREELIKRLQAQLRELGAEPGQ
jgi:Uma2 family endonuclease